MFIAVQPLLNKTYASNNSLSMLCLLKSNKHVFYLRAVEGFKI